MFRRKDNTEMESQRLASGSERRECQRFPCTSPIMFENFLTGNYHDGRMINYSRSGMCFEADLAPDFGLEIFIGIEKSPYSSQHDVFRAQVVWVRALLIKDSYYSHGVGVRFC
jgi:PilZ domain